MSSLEQQIYHANPESSITANVPMIGPSNTRTGYGNHFVQLVLGMLRNGANVHVWPTDCEPPLPVEFLACMVRDWPWTSPIKVMMANPAGLERRGAYTIGMSTWETTRFPADELKEPLRKSVDEVIVPCAANIDVFRQLDPDIPITVHPEGIDVDFWEFKQRDWATEPIRIGMFGALDNRKGIDIAIQAFLEAFEGAPEVELHIGTTYPDFPAVHVYPHIYPNIKVTIFGSQTQREVLEFYHSLHALFAPFRGEGWFLPGTEFMATGGVLIAPNEMGTAGYHSQMTGWVIPSHYEPVVNWGPFHGQEATDRYGEWLGYELSDVVDTLISFVDSTPAEKKERGEQAHGCIPHLADRDAAAQKLLDRFIAVSALV